MPIRHAEARWEGSLKEGGGHLRLESGIYEGPYTWADRFADGGGTNPDELLGAALASCYAMFLSAILTRDNITPTRIDAKTAVHLTTDNLTITRIDLDVAAEVPGLDGDKFQEYAQKAKEGCPVSKALGAVKEVVLTATLVS